MVATPVLEPAGVPTVTGDAALPVVAPEVRARLTTPAPTGSHSWAWTGLIALIAAVLRIIGLRNPPGKIFDEIYYATDAHSLLQHGVEWDAKNNGPEFVVHPPLGKWLIGVGEQLFGYNEFGWRIASVVAGVTAVVIMTRLARRLFGSTLLGCVAGLLMALDGAEFVLSRTALLDIFLMMFLLGSFACLVADREATRRRLLAQLDAGWDPRSRRGSRKALLTPGYRSWPWWRLASAALLGCAGAVKWSALFYAVLFVVLIYVWEARARRSAGTPHPWLDVLVDELGWIVAYIGVAGAVYLASWSGWLATNDGYDRHWLASTGQHEYPIIGALVNLWHYQREALSFHTGLDAKHPYQSWPLTWLLMSRPVAFYYSGQGRCGADSCSAEVLLLGTPLLWWSFLPALTGTLWCTIARRDWRGWPILLGVVVGIAPWLLFPKRTMFFFYALPAEPFAILAVVYLLGIVLGRRSADRSRRRVRALLVGGYVTAIAWCFAYFYPLFTAMPIAHAQWWARMWLGNHWV